MRLYAHSKENEREECWQTLDEHLNNVASCARAFAEPFGAGEWGYAAGLWHDLGKATLEFQNRLRGSNYKVNHSTAGALLAVRLLSQKPPWGNILASCITGHHGGLLDGISKDACLLSRLKEESIPELVDGFTPPRLQVLPQKPPVSLRRATIGFQLAFFTRMVFSCLVDADFLDTERFLDPEKAGWRKMQPELTGLHKRFKKSLEEMLGNVNDTLINRYRNDILQTCIDKAAHEPGLFSLTVPTGGGKTISSLAFALEHARLHGLQRIIYVIPFTSIIEQNAEVFRRFLGEDAVVEHHSSFDIERRFPEGSESLEIGRSFELSSENWDASLIITTGVQFFESLFSSKPSRCRKLHNLARSIIILDEAQMLPISLLAPCTQAIQELSSNYGASVVLCTATQPSLKKSEKLKMGLHDEIEEIIEEPQKLYEALRRVKVESIGELSVSDLAALIKKEEQVLCIVNTRNEAREVFSEISGDEGAYHLSALMCPEHRSRKLDEIRARLEQGLPCRVACTRLIEAGVDIDFPVVFRAIAGIDSIAQAAGRCNRNGKIEVGRAVIYSLKGRSIPLDFRPPAESAQEVMLTFDDPLCLDAVEKYFNLLYSRYGEQLDQKKIMERFQESSHQILFPFRSVSEDFKVIKDGGEILIVPFDDNARSLLESLRHARLHGRILRRLQRYGVQTPWRQMRELEENGAVERIHGVYPVLTDYGYEHRYRDDTGLAPNDNMPVDPACLIF